MRQIYLSEYVTEVSPGYLASSAVLHVVREHYSTVSQVADREGVHHIESHRPVLLALQHDSVEVTQTEQYALHLAVKIFETLLIQTCKSSLDICFQPCRRLVGDLYAPVEQSYRDGVGCIRGEEQTELLVATFQSKLIQFLLKIYQPPRH